MTAFLGYCLVMGQMSLWGINFCLKCIDFYLYFFSNNNELLDYSLLNMITPFLITAAPSPLRGQRSEARVNQSLHLVKNITRLRSNYRIGPHSMDILSIIFGSLLGDAFAENRKQGNGTRICFYQEASHLSYLIYLHKLISNLGYCNINLPKSHTRLGKGGVIRKICRFNTWTYSSFNWIHELWYINGIKIVPQNIYQYLTPLALAIWIMDDGTKSNKGLKLATNSFSFSDCNLLVKVLNDNFNLKSSVQSAGIENQYIIYIWQESMPNLRQLILPFFDPSMKYKIIN